MEYETDTRHYGHVDCPGHIDYIKNMITGDFFIRIWKVGEKKYVFCYFFFSGFISTNKFIFLLSFSLLN